MNDRVLLIDDDPWVLSVLTRLLGNRFAIMTASCGCDGLAAAERAAAEGRPFAVTVCDMHMPDMDGIETLLRIHQSSPLTVSTMLTGDADQSTAIEAINRGSIFRFFVKPFDGARLAEGITQGVRQHELLVAEQRLAENEERWRLALQAVGDCVWDWAPERGEVVYSPGWWRMLGLSPQGGCQSVPPWSDRIHPEDTVSVTAQLSRLLANEDGVLACEHRLRADDGSYRWFLARGTVLFRDADGRALRVIGTHTDITERRRMEDTLRRQAEELARLATTDVLTGLGNRRHFLERAEEELCRAVRYGRPLAAVMIDLDHFKQINDLFGHAGGDAVLRQFATLLRGHLRQSDCLGRIGGEEFALLLPECDRDRAAVAAETLRRETEATVFILTDGRRLKITASFGIAAALPETDSVPDLLRRADEALYVAKAAGRNRVACASDDGTANAAAGPPCDDLAKDLA